MAKMDLSIIILRFVLTFVLALLFGFERQRSHKPIGFGTFTFVAIGACGLAITAITLGLDSHIPLLGAIVTSIGFLGAGALIKTTDKIFGFTTAASIWIFAIFGLMIGIGEYFTGLIVYGSIWLVVLIDLYLEKQGIGSYQRKLTLHTNKLINENEIKQIFTDCSITKSKLINAEVNKKENTITKAYYIEGKKDNINNVPKELYKKEWFTSCKVD